MSKTYQNSKIDTPDALELTVPEQVSVVMAEVVSDLREGLLALAVGTGLQVMSALMEEDVTALAGPKGKHNSDRAAVRHGHEAGSVALGGRRVPVARPRVRAADGSGELPVPAYALFNSTELLGRLAMEKMLAGLSTRRYAPAGLEPVGEQVTASARSTSKSAVSRRLSCRSGCVRGWSDGCARPTTPTPRWPPRRSSTRWPASWTRPTRARPRVCARAWPRH